MEEQNMDGGHIVTPFKAGMARSDRTEPRSNGKEEIGSKLSRVNIKDVGQLVQQQHQVKKQNRQKLPNQYMDRKITPNQEEKKDLQLMNKNLMDIEARNSAKMSFQDLPLEVEFYMTDVYQHQFNKLFISGVLSNGQTLTLMANDVARDLYFCLKRQNEDSDLVSQQFMAKAKREIDQKIKDSGINVLFTQFVERSYAFEINQIPRGRRPYYRVRYPYKIEGKDAPKPDWEGQHFKYVFGTTYTPLEVLIVNSQIKGPEWVRVDKKYLIENKKSADCLCVDIVNPEKLQPMTEKPPKSPKMRVMAISIKTVMPSKIKIKKLFNTNRIDENHIYALSYHLCEDYCVESKPNKPILRSKTFYLREFGKFRDPNLIPCNDQTDIFDRLTADLAMYDPDFIACHDATVIIDTVLQRIQINKKDKLSKPRLGRLFQAYDISKTNQTQRINASLAGRLLVDTFVHSKDMIKEVDYSLESMSKYIKPERNFKGVNEEQIIQLLNKGNTQMAIKSAHEQSQCTFALMNHLEVIQMTRSLTNICGNTWKRSLENQRAERNQFLIMHECQHRQIIIPDKYRASKGEEGQEGDRKKYVGGLVLNPEVGMYNDFILLLDFNSLYPSLIRQYNICFSVIDRPKLPFSYYYKSKVQKKGQKQKIQHQNKQAMEVEGGPIDEAQVEPPAPEECVREKWGFLPYLIDKIVQKRKQCKRQMKFASADKVIILDIQQKSFKIVANSIYGCLGFKFNRFYSKHLAALVTRMGRDALRRGRDIVESRGVFKVIYGDTDSLMIQPVSFVSDTNKEKIFQLKNAAHDLKKQINQEYRNLEIDIDGIYKPLILLQKKKYVANKLQNYEDVIFSKAEPVFNIEYKGIEVVRRDGCKISRTVLKQVIDILMRGQKTQLEQIQQEIVEYFQKLQARLNKPVDFKEFMLANFLSKKPTDYGQSGDQLPHVKVAKDRVRNGEKEEALVGHIIYYIVCEGRDETEDTYPKRSWDDRTFQKSQKSANPLKIDFKYYRQEILRPVARILGTVKVQLDRIFDVMKVQSLERDKIKKFVRTEELDDHNPIMQGNTLEVMLNKDFMQKSQRLEEEMGKFKCCDLEQSLIVNQKFRLKCQKQNCPKSFTHVLHNKLSMMLKKKTAEYYSNNFKCKCGKQFILTPISKCCQITNQEKSRIPSQLHYTLYICKDVCETTRKDIAKMLDTPQNIYETTRKQITKVIDAREDIDEATKKETAKAIDALKEAEKKLDKMMKIIDGFLKMSEYEDLTGLFGRIHL